MFWGEAVGYWALGEIPVAEDVTIPAGWWQTITTRQPYDEDEEIALLWFEWMNYYHDGYTL